MDLLRELATVLAIEIAAQIALHFESIATTCDCLASVQAAICY